MKPIWYRNRAALAAVLAAVSAAFLFGDHPSPLPDTITTPNFNYNIRFTDNDSTDNNFFPNAQAQNMANALDSNNPPSAGNPSGYHPGYTGLGFLAPNFSGGSNDVFCFDCSMHGGCDTGNAPADRINMPVSFYAGQTEPCLRVVLGHELFHHVQYAYITFAQWSVWGSTPVEGTARLMQDKVFSDLDAAGGCITYLSEINNYLAAPNQNIWNASYTSAIFWNYLMEQLGTSNAEPGPGTDFIRSFWENAQENNDSPDTIGTVRETVSEYGSSRTLEQLFHDFAICNYAKDLDLAGIPEAARYRYKDENDGTGQSYNAVAQAWSGPVPPTKGPQADTVSAWGAKYYEATPSVECRIVGFRATGEEAAWAVIAVTGADDAMRLRKGTGTEFARAFMNRSANPYTRLVAVAAGLTDSADFEYTFACGSARIQIVRPNTAFKAFVGEPAAPERFLIILNVDGPDELGNPSVEGLDLTDFQAWVGDEDPANAAPLLSGAYVQGAYWIVAQAPVKATDGTYPLRVRLGDLGEDTKLGVVEYTKRVRDQVVVIDVSGSMNAPAGNTKFDAAKNAGRLFVDAASDDDQLGVVWFSGDGVEPNDDGQAVHLLQPVAGVRGTARAAVDGLSLRGLTSIGDGLRLGQNEINQRGNAEGQDEIVLLSDGLENEADFWATVRPAILAAGTTVHAIALGPQADQALMQEIAGDTGGDYLYVDLAGAGGGGISPSSLPLPNRLADAFRSINERIRHHDRLWEAAGTLGQGEKATLKIPVEERSVTELVFTFNWANRAAPIDVRLFRPDGSEVLAGQSGVLVLGDATHKAFHHEKNPGTGTWTAELFARAGSQWLGSLSAWNRQGVQLAVYLGQQHSDPTASTLRRKFLRGLPMPILASLTDQKGAVRGAKVVARIEHPDGQSDVLQLLDDGSHGDGEADDGIYAGLYTRTTVGSTFGVDDRDKETPPTRGSYLVRVDAAGESNGGEPFERVRKTAFQLFEFHPDLKPTQDPDVDQDGLPDRWEALHPCLGLGAADGRSDDDADGLTALEELRLGTDPCDADTDGGGETDLSEAKRGANPHDPRDDSAPCVQDVEILAFSPDHQLPLPLKPGQNLIRYPVLRAAGLIRVQRSENAAGPFEQVAEFDPRKFGGLFPDTGLRDGSTYFYRLVGVGRNGEVACPSPIVSGTPRKDPFPPLGSIQIERGRPFTDSAKVVLTLTADADVKEMILSNSPSFAGARFQPFQPQLNWVLDPEESGSAQVCVRYRDGEGNVSTVYHDDIEVVKEGSLGSIGGEALLEGKDDHSGIFVAVASDPGEAPAFTDAKGSYGLADLLPGSYTLEFSRAGFKKAQLAAVRVVSGQTTTAPPVVLEPLSGSGHQFHRGDFNADGRDDISDAQAILSFLFLGGTPPGCRETADVNNDALVDISDGTALLGYLFLGAARPPAPGPAPGPCGRDVDAPGSKGDLGCAEYTPCE